MFRCAKENEKEKIIEFYDIVIEANNKSLINLRWQKDVHPSHKLLNSSVDNKELFIYEENGEILGACVMNKSYNESYNKVSWGIDAKDDEIGVIHVLAISPMHFREGIGKKFISGLILHAEKAGIKAIRLDVFKINVPAIKLYKMMGFELKAEIPMFVPNIGDEDFELYEYLVTK